MFESQACYLCSSAKSTPFISANEDLTGKPGTFHFVTCDECGLCYQNPRVDMDHIKDFYDKEYIAHRKKKNWGPLGPLYEWVMNKHDKDKAKLVKRYMKIGPETRILDVGCAKGFMLYEFQKLMPDLHLEGLDISEYALRTAQPEVKSCLHLGNAKELPYEDDSFDLVLSISTIHNLAFDECSQSLLEIQRVSRGDSFIYVDAWRNDDERQRFLNWNLTALTYMHRDEWIEYFAKVGYDGDYYWFIAE